MDLAGVLRLGTTDGADVAIVFEKGVTNFPPPSLADDLSQIAAKKRTRDGRYPELKGRQVRHIVSAVTKNVRQRVATSEGRRLTGKASTKPPRAEQK